MPADTPAGAIALLIRHRGSGAWRLAVVAAFLAAFLAAVFAPTVGNAVEAGGTWRGRYICNQGLTRLTLTVTPSEAGTVQAVFRVYPVEGNPGVADGCFAMSGALSGDQLHLEARSWLYRPPGYVTVDLTGTVNPADMSLTGSIIGPNCTTFSLSRVSSDPDPEMCRPKRVPVS